jgi:hypothetical protein
VSNAKSVTGCLLAFLQLGIGTPLWLYLMYQVLIRLDIPPHVWTAYWVYVPFMLISAVVRAIWEQS